MAKKLLILGGTAAAGYDWQARIPQVTVINCATSGLTTSALLTSLPELQKSHPDADFTMVAIGAADIAAGSRSIQNNILEIGRRLLADRPLSELLIVSLPPLAVEGADLDAIRTINRHISDTTMYLGSVYIDIFTPMQQAIDNGRQIFDHTGSLAAAGYDIWVKMLVEHLAYLEDDD